jgi:uncharacterized iron-regulated protein
MIKLKPRIFFGLVISSFVGLAACQSTVNPHSMMMRSDHDNFGIRVWRPDHPGAYEIPGVIDLKTMPDFSALMKVLKQKRVVYVGETHDRMDHHLNQLEIIRRLYEANPDLAIGMEFFQQPFQQYMDQYIAGKIDEREFLKKTEYFQRWRMDYRYYRPIIQFAKQHSIPLVALDIAEEIQHKVGREGIQSLDAAEREQIPKEIDRSNEKYRALLESIYSRHPHGPNQDFKKFSDVQYLRDESMAQAAANYLQNNPNDRLVILAGGGHLIYGYGIPDRLKRRIDVKYTVVLNDSPVEPSRDLADYVLLPSPLRLPAAGKLGVILETSTTGGVGIQDFSEDSPAKLAGMKSQDRIVGLNGQSIEQYADLKYALLERQPGDKVKVKVQRKDFFGNDKEMQFDVELY